jgi:hypothetical protein
MDTQKREASSFGRRTRMLVIPATDTIIVSDDDDASADFATWQSRRIRGVELRPKISAAAQIRLLHLRIDVALPKELRDFPDVWRETTSKGDGLTIETTASMILFPPGIGTKAMCHVTRCFGSALAVHSADLVFDHTILASATLQDAQQWTTAAIIGETPGHSERVETTFDAAMSAITAVWSGRSFADLLDDR